MFFQKKIALFGALAFLVACTDYVQQIDDCYAERFSSLSSETVKNSSGSAKSSSSVKIEVTKGTMTDSRDSQTYKTVKIGNQVWMAENLNFKTDSSFCYNNEENNCIKYGRLYRWAAAVGKPEIECGYGNKCSLLSGNIQGVCPNGWHLPRQNEWDTLFNAVGGSSTAGKERMFSSGWFSSGYGTDAFGFSVLLTGYRGDNGNYSKEGNYASFWSSTEWRSSSAYCMELYYNGVGARLVTGDKNKGFSVRCLQDDASGQTAKSSSSVNSSSSRLSVHAGVVGERVAFFVASPDNKERDFNLYSDSDLSYTLTLSAGATLYRNKDDQTPLSLPYDGKVDEDGVDTLWVSYPLGLVTSSETKVLVSLRTAAMDSVAALLLTFITPLVQFVKTDSTDALGNVVSWRPVTQDPDVDGNGVEYFHWVGSDVDFIVLVYNPTKGTICTQCNFPMAILEKSDGIVGEVSELNQGIATVRIHSNIEYSLQAAEMIVGAQENPGVATLYGNMHFHEPPAPMPLNVDMFGMKDALWVK